MLSKYQKYRRTTCDCGRPTYAVFAEPYTVRLAGRSDF